MQTQVLRCDPALARISSSTSSTDEESCGLTEVLSPEAVSLKFDGLTVPAAAAAAAAPARRVSQRQARAAADAKLWLRQLVGSRKLKRRGYGTELVLRRELEEWHRVVCVDWIVEVCNAFSLRQATLSRFAALFDEVLRSLRPKKAELQKYAITCLVLAAKMEEFWAVNLQEFADMTCGIASVQSILEAEMEILTRLGFLAVCPSVDDFLRGLLKYLAPRLPAEESVGRIRDVAAYLSEAAYYSTACSNTPLPALAAAVLSTATGAKYDDVISEAVRDLFDVHCWEDGRRAVFEAVQECFVHDFVNVVKDRSSDLSLATQSRHEGILKNTSPKRTRDEEDDDESNSACNGSSEADDAESCDASPGCSSTSSSSASSCKKRRTV
ncbi:hypothetical protein DIPPA_12333 [Diplonema papillatum]|nr:hypothetical protein DIPPA_12333 [Diplonema papillatum]